jgi:hypothetical protein
MQLKDYYKILEVPPAASVQDIKKSFRKLAQRYHPDKNAGSQIAGAHFMEIQEAYKVLSDPRERESYNYKRWYIRSTGQPFASQPVTPTALLEACRLLKQYIASMNVFHVNYDAVSLHISQLLTKEAISMLHEYNDMTINHEIIYLLLQAAQPLPQRYFIPLIDLLLQLAGDDRMAQTSIAEALQQKKQRHTWDRYKWVVMLVVTALICWLMYRYGK